MKVFIGYDPRESIAAYTLMQSIIEHAKAPVSFTLLKADNLPMITREPDPRSSNAFTYSRFLVPYLCGYQGKALYMDCDMLCRFQIHEILDIAEGNHDVWCVQHDYTPKPGKKYLGNEQYNYPRKNWSSLMLFDCARCKKLTVNKVNQASPAWLHRMSWAKSVGELPIDYNHLVDEYPPNSQAKIVHYTRGGPWFNDFYGVEFTDEWVQAMLKTVHVTDRFGGFNVDLRGNADAGSQ